MTNSFEKQSDGREEDIPLFRVVGEAAKEEKEESAKSLKWHFREGLLGAAPAGLRRELNKNELPMTPEERFFVGLANKKTNEILKKAGITPLDISEKNIHIVPKEAFLNIAGISSPADAVALVESRMALFNAEEVRSVPFSFAYSVFHEMMHLKEYIAIEGRENDDEEDEYSLFRVGFTAYSSLKKMEEEEDQHTHFRGLDEAIIASLEKSYAKELLELPMFADGRNLMISRQGKKLAKSVSGAVDYSEDELIWIEPRENIALFASYYPQRKVLDFVCGEIREDFPDRFGSPSEVFGEFMKAAFSGRLLEAARLTEKTFGKGSFRILGDMNIDDDSATNTMETLESMRRAQLKTAN